MDKCPICLSGYVRGARVKKSGDRLYVDCPACGGFTISQNAWEDCLNPENSIHHEFTSVQRARLTHRIRMAETAEQTHRLITIRYIEGFVSDGCPGPIPAEQAKKLIRYVGDEFALTGQRLEQLPPDLYAIIGAPNPRSAVDLTYELIRQNNLSGAYAGELNGIPNCSNVGLTLAGWEIYEAEKRGRFSGKIGFIALQFNDPILDPLVTDIIKPAIEQGIGYELVDMRNVARAGLIDNIMRNQIRDSAFVLVDLTHDNAGAYWEAGYAEGLGKPVIYICEAEKFDGAKTHFDTNHCTTVVWSEEDTETFASNLVATLRRSLNLFDS